MDQKLILEWKSRVGTQAEKPTEVDTISSPTTVYLRKEIEQVEIEQESGNIQGYKYLEVELTPEQYELYKADMEKPSMQATMQAIQDMQATQEMQGIDLAINTETIMQTLSDIQADIALLTE